MIPSLCTYMSPRDRLSLTANLSCYVATCASLDSRKTSGLLSRSIYPRSRLAARGAQQFHPRGKSVGRATERQRSARSARRTAVDRHNSRCCIIVPGFPYVIAISVQRPCEINFLRTGLADEKPTRSSSMHHCSTV